MALGRAIGRGASSLGRFPMRHPVAAVTPFALLGLGNGLFSGTSKYAKESFWGQNFGPMLQSYGQYEAFRRFDLGRQSQILKSINTGMPIGQQYRFAGTVARSSGGRGFR